MLDGAHPCRIHRRWMKGTRSWKIWRAVIATLRWVPPVADYVRDLLARLGYRASVRVVTPDAYDAALGYTGKRRRAQVAMPGWSTDYPADSGFLGAIAACGAPSNESGFCDPRIDKRMTAATRLQISEPSLAIRRWASIAHDVMDQAPWVPLVSRSWANVVSRRLGHFEVSTVWGPLLDQMWVR
jgi:peptide/nickel transport system substrate-binding protein